MATKSLDAQHKALQRKLRKLEKGILPAAKISASNKVANRIRTRVVKGVSKQAQVPQKEIRKKFFVSRANKKRGRVRLYMYRTGIAAISLKPKQIGGKRKPRGIRAGGRQWRNAFMANGMTSTSKGVLRGRAQVLARKGSDRYPLKVIKVDIADEVNTIMPVVAKRVVKTEHPKLLAHELEWRTNKIFKGE